MRSTRIFEAKDNRLIQPQNHIRHALDHGVFLGYWMRRTLLTRYRQTTLGPVWVILQPLLAGLVYAFVFALLLRVQTPVPYAVFVVTNLSLWSYSARPILVGPTALLGNLDLVTRVQFPREFLPLGVWLESLTDFLIGAVVVAGFFVYYRVPVTNYAFVALAVFVVHTMFTLGATFIVAAVTITVRDLLYVVPLLLQLGLYLAPVVYPVDLVPESARSLYFINPLGTIFAAYQETLFEGRFTLGRELMLSAAISAAMLVFGYRLFKQQEWKLADVL
jgi:lipopolysaccharide transport system permease protein